MPYDHVTVNMEKEEVCLKCTTPALDPRLVGTTTGGVEASCQDCLLPFGLFLCITGLAATSVAWAHDPPGSALTVLGLIVLMVGVLGLAVSCLCYCYRKWKKARRGSWSLLVAEAQAKKVVV